MGKLKPGAKYIYERSDGVVYAREFGAPDKDKFEIGHYPDSRTSDGRPLVEHIKENQLWGNIHRAAKDNPALQDALNKVIELYYLYR
jgi:hypothetical protein